MARFRQPPEEPPGAEPAGLGHPPRLGKTITASLLGIHVRCSGLSPSPTHTYTYTHIHIRIHARASGHTPHTRACAALRGICRLIGLRRGVNYKADLIGEAKGSSPLPEDSGRSSGGPLPPRARRRGTAPCGREKRQLRGAEPDRAGQGRAGRGLGWCGRGSARKSDGATYWPCCGAAPLRGGWGAVRGEHGEGRGAAGAALLASLGCWAQGAREVRGAAVLCAVGSIQTGECGRAECAGECVAARRCSRCASACVRSVCEDALCTRV